MSQYNIGTSLDGKPVHLYDQATAQGVVTSVSAGYTTIQLGNSGASVTIDNRDVHGRFPFGSGVLPSVNERVSFNGQVTGCTGSGQIATLTLQMKYPVQLALSGSPGLPVTTVNVSAYDVVASQSR